MPCLFPMFSHEEFVNAYGVITLKKRPSFGLKNGLRLGTLSKAKAHRRRAGTVSEGFRRCAPTSLGDREQCITRCDYVALCLPSYPYVSQLTTDTPSNTNAALTCGT